MEAAQAGVEVFDGKVFFLLLDGGKQLGEGAFFRQAAGLALVEIADRVVRPGQSGSGAVWNARAGFVGAFDALGHAVGQGVEAAADAAADAGPEEG